MKEFSEPFQVSIIGLPDIPFYVSSDAVSKLLTSFRSLEANKNVSSNSILKEITKGEKFENKFISISLRKELLPNPPKIPKPKKTKA
jgi:hypothetical protein